MPHPQAILPSTTLPPENARTQRHTPTPANRYQAYRSCLRWDAGFTCCYCLLHESDLAPGYENAEGTALFWIEHIEPRSTSPELEDDYANRAFACRFCNNVRRDTPIKDESGARLLHPWRDAWADYFELHEDRLVPRQANAKRHRDARYTSESYRINDERRVRLRRKRREIISDRIQLLSQDVGKVRHLAMKQPNAEDRAKLMTWALSLSKQQHLARVELLERKVVPSDAPNACRCTTTSNHTYPKELPALRVPEST